MILTMTLKVVLKKRFIIVYSLSNTRERLMKNVHKKIQITENLGVLTIFNLERKFHRTENIGEIATTIVLEQVG